MFTKPVNAQVRKGTNQRYAAKLMPHYGAAWMQFWVIRVRSPSDSAYVHPHRALLSEHWTRRLVFCVIAMIYIYIYMVPPPKIDHFLCFISGDTSQNLQGLGLLASQLHLASAFWLHRMNMLKKPEEIKKKQKKSRSWNRLPRPTDYLSQGLDFLFFDFLKVFHFSRF